MLSFLEVVFESSLQLVPLIRVTGLHQIINYSLTNNIELFENSFRRAGKDEIVKIFITSCVRAARNCKHCTLPLCFDLFFRIFT